MARKYTAITTYLVYSHKEDDEEMSGEHRKIRQRKEERAEKRSNEQKNTSNTWILSAIMPVQGRKMKGETKKEGVSGLLLSMAMGSSGKTEI